MNFFLFVLFPYVYEIFFWIGLILFLFFIKIKLHLKYGFPEDVFRKYSFFSIIFFINRCNYCLSFKILNTFFGHVISEKFENESKSQRPISVNHNQSNINCNIYFTIDRAPINWLQANRSIWHWCGPFVISNRYRKYCSCI